MTIYVDNTISPYSLEENLHESITKLNLTTAIFMLIQWKYGTKIVEYTRMSFSCVCVIKGVWDMM